MREPIEMREHPDIASLVSRADLSLTQRKTVDDWLSLSAEVQALVPHVAELMTVAIGNQRYWDEMSESERNIMRYSTVALLAEAQRRAGPQAEGG